jgi:signal recognition particle subunit SRP54
MAMANPDRQKEMAKKLTEGKFSIRDWREQLGSMMNMYVLLPTVTIMELTDRGSLSKITSMIPGMSGMMEEGGEEEASAKLKRMIFITDAMRADELDSDGLIFVSFKFHDLEPS